MVRDVKLEQFQKALSPIDVTELGMVRDVKLEQFQKALSPIDVTELGMVRDVKPEQPRKASTPIDVTPSGITVVLHPLINSLAEVFIIALQDSLESYTGLPSSTIIDVKPAHQENAPSPIDVTELGMMMNVKPEQPEKAEPPIDVTPSGITVLLHPLINSLAEVFIIALQDSLESYTGLPSSTIIDVKPVQPLKALSPIDVTELGMMRDVKPVQPLKALSPIDVTELGMVRDVKPEQAQKA